MFCRIYIVIARLAGGRPICLITSIITDQIGRHEVLLPINQHYNKKCDILGFSKSKHQKFCSHGIEKKKSFKHARDGVYCPITLSN